MGRVLKKYYNVDWWANAIMARINDGFASIGFKPHTAFLDVNGIKFKFFIATPLGKNWYEHPQIESEELRALTSLFPIKGAVVFECGGHHGRDCVLLAKLAGDHGRVITFEPHPQNSEVLRNNVALNDLNTVTTVEAAVGAAPGETFIKAASNAKVAGGRNGAIAVPLVSIDSWAEQNQIWPNIIKIDVEGYEFQVLRGARRALSRKPSILIELHCDILEEFDCKPEELWSLIDMKAYDVYLQKDDASTPERFEPGHALKGRPHLFFVPKA